MQSCKAIGRCWLVVVLAAVFNGCDAGPPRFPIAGNVTYDGQPVKMGSIRFQGDVSVGDIGSTCYAQIVDGKYEAATEERPAKGKFTVQVMGIDTARIKKDGPPGTPWEMPALFPPYSTTVELPVENGRFDIDIPSKANRSAR